MFTCNYTVFIIGLPETINRFLNNKIYIKLFTKNGGKVKEDEVILMAVQVLINLSVALLWMFFNDSWDGAHFLTGYLVGLFIVFSVRKYFDSKFYIVTLIAAIKLIFIFIKEIIISSILVIKQILEPKMSIKPGVLVFETKLESDFEVTLISLLITLTPGSVVIEVSDDKKKLLLHIMDMPISSKVVLNSLHIYEKAIMEVTR